MVKRVTIVSIPETSDPDAFWKWWLEDHAQIVRTYPGLKKYVISRVERVTQESDKLAFFGMVETWWENEDSLPKALEAPEAKRTYNEFVSGVSDRFSAIMEEKEIPL